MADREQYPPQYRIRQTPPHKGRPGQNRIYQHLGVCDLREIIDRKRQERGQTNEGRVTPPDPSGNHLKEPLRESSHNVQESSKPVHVHKTKNNASNSLKRNKERNKEHLNEVQDRDIENPLNIKVEFSPSTGEHVYKLDDTTFLPTIKHVPDHQPFQNNSFIGRGRGCRRRPKSYQTRTIRNNRRHNETGNTEEIASDSSMPKENWDDEVNETKEATDIDAGKQELVYQGTKKTVSDENAALEKGIENLKVNETESLSIPKSEESISTGN